MLAPVDIMPTLLQMAGVDVPDCVEGMSMVGQAQRSHLYGEIGEGASATRMMHDGQHKLIYYPAGNVSQLFDLQEDPQELADVAGDPAYATVLGQLQDRLIQELYGSDLPWISEGRLVGSENPAWHPGPNRGLSGQRGLH